MQVCASGHVKLNLPTLLLYTVGNSHLHKSWHYIGNILGDQIIFVNLKLYCNDTCDEIGISYTL